MSELTIGPGDGASLSIGTLMGDMERGGAFTRDFERKVQKTLETGVSLFRGPFFGEPVELLTGHVGKALGMSIPLYGGSVGQPGVGSSTGDFERRMKGLWRCGVSLCGSSVKGTWREGFLAGDPEGYAEKALETGISFHRGPVFWGTWRRARLPGTLREG